MDSWEERKLIAEFMGAKIKDKTFYFDGIVFKTGKNFFKQEELNFYWSWDWLMPVVEKIENEIKHPLIPYDYIEVKFHKSQSEFGCSIFGYIKHKQTPSIDFLTTLVSEMGDCKREVVYNSVVKFIIWFNQQKS